MLSVFATVIDGRDALYVSSPFTTGRHAADWIARNGIGQPEDALNSDHFREQILAANRERAAEFVRSIRRHRPEVPVVISPTALPDVPSWTQADYRFFWGRVIAKYAERVVFLEGWENSSGCAYEYLCAVSSGAKTLNEHLRPLSFQEALKRLDNAAAHNNVPAGAAFLRAAAVALREESGVAGRGHQ